MLNQSRADGADDQDQRRRGRVKWFDQSLGFGFIEDPGGDIFLHRVELHGVMFVLAGDQVTYVLRRGPRGQAAREVRLVT